MKLAYYQAILKKHFRLISMIRFATIIVFCFLIMPLSAQISGIIVDKNSGLPIQNATVYIDGSTVGTTTDKDGQFILKNALIPCQLIFSHISYEVQAKMVKNNSKSVNIKLKPRLVQIQEFSIQNKNIREDNIRTFRKYFLGTDFWGRNAEILNDSVLFFTHKTDSIIPEKNDTIVQLKYKQVKSKTLRVDALAPLWIRLPLLGYKIRVDLIGLTVHRDFIQKVSIGSYQGFFHFIPFEEMSRRDKRVFTANRRKAYYQSRQHFGKSLYEGKLAENGYRLLEETKDSCVDEKNEDIKIEGFDLFSHLTHQKGGASLNNMKGRVFEIKYYQRASQKPVNLEKSIGYQEYKSKMHILSDTAWFYSSGSTPNQDVMFSGSISYKKVGAFVPEDYLPSDKIE